MVSESHHRKIAHQMVRDEAQAGMMVDKSDGGWCVYREGAVLAGPFETPNHEHGGG
jgi:hypothetical protein